MGAFGLDPLAVTGDDGRQLLDLPRSDLQFRPQGFGLPGSLSPIFSVLGGLIGQLLREFGSPFLSHKLAPPASKLPPPVAKSQKQSVHSE